MRPLCVDSWSAYGKLRNENTQLKGELAECKRQLADTQQLVAEAQHRYNLLKTARMIEVSGDDVKESRARLSKLIREVDQMHCFAQCVSTAWQKM